MIKSYFKSRFLNDRSLRTRIFLTCGLFFNLSYAVFKLVTGIIYHSSWFISVAVYYILLSFNRFTVLKGFSTSLAFEETKQRRLLEAKYCIMSGIMLLVTDIVISVIAGFMIYENRAFNYSGIIIYLSAFYTAYRLFSATCNLIKRRFFKTPLLRVATSLNLAVALMSVFTLQISLLAKYHSLTKSVRAANITTALIVLLSITIIALIIIIRSSKEYKKIKNTLR